MDEEKIDKVFHSRDLTFRYIADKWAKDLHKNLKLAGEFEELLSNDFAKNIKTNRRMDILMLVRLKNGKKLAINLEHQSSKLNLNKLSSLWDYKNYTICNRHYSVLTVAITPFSKESQLTRYEATKSDILEAEILCIDKKDIQKRLNILKDNIKNNNHIENHITLNFSIIAIFVEENEYEILKELSTLFNEAKSKIPENIALDTELVLTGMIEQKLINNKKEVKELIRMYSEDDKEIARRGVRFIFAEEFDELEKEIDEKNNKISQMSDKIGQMSDEIKRIKKEHSDEITRILCQKNSEIADLKSKIEINGIS